MLSEELRWLLGFSSILALVWSWIQFEKAIHSDYPSNYGRGRSIRLGIIADVQYADKDDKDAGPNRVYHFRDAIHKLNRTLKWLSEANIRALVNLGDLIDGNTTTNQTEIEFELAMQAFKSSSLSPIHVVGNHCLELGRNQLISRLYGDVSASTFGEHSLGEGWVLLRLDTTDFGVSGSPEYHQLAREWLKSNEHKDNCYAWNSTCGPKQMDWLRTRCAELRKSGKRAIVVGHHPISAAASSASHISWDAFDLAGLFREYSDVIRLYLSGHYHPGGYSFEDKVHHVTIESVLEGPVGHNCFGILEIFENVILITGHGSVQTRTLKL
eukprot:c7645_g1_i1.p1 GENE.c7645_g1_i1~~c7645_g1_i1.p1  ORF type:complete len:326 (-),score=58.84 c7645_g1_i1:24-1001(-)